MENAKHTPGPWIINNVQSDCLYIDADQGKQWDNPTICALYKDVTPEDSITMMAWLKPFENAESNARLIAVAPELLSLVKELSSLTKQYGSGNLGYLNNKANALIAKAEGRE
jgi:hypothetical protein